MADSITIDGVGPMPVERPSTVAELCAIVRRCADTKTAIYPVGGGTMLDFGMPPARPGSALSTAALNEVIDYPARDLTITVQAGITLLELQATLAKENQWLPIDIPETATIGGAIACDVSGPRRYGYGTLRDYVIGITVVNDRGEETHAGGRVVKNVAGYDFMKLHTGALGTLGVITQVTLKVKPKPEAQSLVAFFPEERLADCVEQGIEILRRTKTSPVFSDFGWNSGVHSDGRSKPTRKGCCFFVGFCGNPESVDWQVGQFRKELERTNFDNTVKMDEDFSENCGRIDFRRMVQSRVTFLATLPVSNVGRFCSTCDELKVSALHGPIGCGVLHGFILAVKPDRQSAESQIRKLRDSVDQEMTKLTVLCPSEWKNSIGVWGHPPSDLALQKAVKRALDPQNIFNPGRFVTDAF
jgi:glycolate oxidase FAD binding subunit